MPPQLPPPAGNKSTSKSAVYERYIKAHPALRPYSDLIWKWGKSYGVDQVYLAALILFESGGNPNARSGKNALGLAQIHMPTWNGHRLPFGVVNERNARNPNFAIHFAAWYFSQKVDQFGSYDAAYRRGYNPGYTGPGPFANTPKGYVPHGSGLSPTEAGQVSVERTVATDVAKGQNPYLQGQAFLQAWHHDIDPIFLAYANRKATKGEARRIIGQGLSAYQIQLELASKPSFFNSQVWKTYAPGYTGVYQSIFGDRKPDKRLISYAIIHNLGESGFAQKLRESPGYIRSDEFNKNVTNLENVYRSIYGAPDKNAAYVIKQATLAGWNADQFAKYLRTQPEYRQSGEFQNVAGQLAAAFGGNATMTLQQATSTASPHTGVPNDSRLGPAPWEQQAQPQPAPKKNPKPNPQPKPKPQPGGYHPPEG